MHSKDAQEQNKKPFILSSNKYLGPTTSQALFQTLGYISEQKGKEA